MKLKHLIAILSITLTTPLAANEVVKTGVAIPLDYTALYLVDKTLADSKAGEIDKKPYFVKLVGLKPGEQYGKNESQLWEALTDLVQLGSGNSAEASCQIVSSLFHHDDYARAAICSIDGKDLGEQLIATGFYSVNRDETYAKGMDIALAKRKTSA